MIAAREQVEAVGIDLGDYRAGRMWAELAAIETDQVGDARDRAALARQLGRVLQGQGELAEAETQMREALALVPEPDALEAVFGRRALATVLIERGEFDEAKALLDEGREIIVARLGTDHPANAEYDYLLGALWLERGDASTAREVMTRALAGYRRAGIDDTRVANVLQNIGNAERLLGNDQGAIAAWEQALAQRERLLGPNHPDVADLLVNLATLLPEQDAAALANYERALAIWTAAGAGESNKVAITRLNYGIKLAQLDRPAEALEHLEQAESIGRATLGDSHPILAEVRLERASCLHELGRDDEARAFARRNLELALDEGFSPSMIGRTRELIARMAVEQGDLELARTELHAALTLTELAPDERQALELTAAQLLWAGGQRAEARAEFERLRALPDLALGVRKRLEELDG
jgi:tetratricopeptide (TPR) repeat protein